MRPLKGALGVGALGALGAVGYGLHHQNQEDREKLPLVSAPLQGTMLQ
jgi:hypothetical protein